MQKLILIHYRRLDEIILTEMQKSKRIKESKIDKYNKIICEALRQSKSYIPTKIKFEKLNKKLLEELKQEELSLKNENDKRSVVNIVLYQEGINFFSEYLKFNKCVSQINIFIGPESGFSDDELLNFKNYNFTFIKINNNILRSETSAITGSALFAALFRVDY